MLIDTHAHLNFKAFAQDRDEVIKRCLEQGVWMVNASSNYETSKLAVEIAEQYKQGVYASVGLHPLNCTVNLSEHAQDRIGEEWREEKYRELAKSPKVVAIGEIGLDYWYEPKTKAKAEQFKQRQKDVFLKQIELAKGLGLPIIFHCRKAHDDLLSCLTNLATARNVSHRGVVHCFTGTWQQAEKFLEMGLYLGFNGIIFKLALDEVIKKIPLDRMLIETDCPFLVPPQVAHKKQRKELSSFFEKEEGAKLLPEKLLPERNEPVYIKYIAQRVAELRNEPIEKIAETTTQNAKQLFDI